VTLPFGANLRSLLLAPPMRPPAVVVGLDPAYRTGCKLAAVDATGALIDTGVLHLAGFGGGGGGGGGRGGGGRGSGGRAWHIVFATTSNASDIRETRTASANAMCCVDICCVVLHCVVWGVMFCVMAVNPHFLNCMPSYDVANNICPALGGGGGRGAHFNDKVEVKDEVKGGGGGDAGAKLRAFCEKCDARAVAIGDGVGTRVWTNHQTLPDSS
jgi:hypothetical protein